MVAWLPKAPSSIPSGPTFFVTGPDTECWWVISSLKSKLTDISVGIGSTTTIGKSKTLSPSTYVGLGPTKSAPKVALPSVQDIETDDVLLNSDSAVR